MRFSLLYPFACICQEENAFAGASRATFSAKRFLRAALEMMEKAQYIYCVSRSPPEIPMRERTKNRTFNPMKYHRHA
jgi:hypothetical protein